MTPILLSEKHYFEVKCFQAHEIVLLQAQNYEQWLTLFTSDARYRMPVLSVRDVAADAESSSSELMHFDDTLDTLKLRVARTRSPSAWTENPPSRIRYFVDPVSIREDGDGIEVTSNMLMYQTRLQREENYFAGYRRDRLRKQDGEWKIADRYAVVDRVVLAAKNLTVFF